MVRYNQPALLGSPKDPPAALDPADPPTPSAGSGVKLMYGKFSAATAGATSSGKAWVAHFHFCNSSLQITSVTIPSNNTK